MYKKWLHSGFFSPHRIKILMWVLAAEILTSALADPQNSTGMLLGLGVRLVVAIADGSKALIINQALLLMRSNPD